MDTAIAWVRSHIGIPGNEEAGKLARESSHYGQVANVTSTRMATEGGLRTTTKAIGKERIGLRLGTATLWPHPATSAYTWLQAEGPQRQWLHHVGKAEDPACPYNKTTPRRATCEEPRERSELNHWSTYRQAGSTTR